ncbi:MAG: DUF4846 domain-containing protein [bacterium]|nr:DUF4846 domain-containing protein [bacterium]
MRDIFSFNSIKIAAIFVLLLSIVLYSNAENHALFNNNLSFAIEKIHSAVITISENHLEEIRKYNATPSQPVFPVKNHGIKNLSCVGHHLNKNQTDYFGLGNTIYVDDKNKDALDDDTNNPFEVLSFDFGIVMNISKHTSQNNQNESGNHLWIYNPQKSRYYLYSHLSDINIKTGDIIRPGTFLGTVSGIAHESNADIQTYLFFLCLEYKNGHLTIPDLLPELMLSRKSFNVDYPWLKKDYNAIHTVNEIPTPNGYRRLEYSPSSFQGWLRGLPLKPEGTPIMLYNGEQKKIQYLHHAIIDIDIGNEDLQQCADIIMRLKAEYHYSREEYDNIHFTFLNGFHFEYSKWVEGNRLNKSLNGWKKKEKHSNSYASFQEYLRQLYYFANTKSLDTEMIPLKTGELQPGDVFIQGIKEQFNHAVIILDVAENEQGEKVFIIARSNTPTQDFEILKTPNGKSPWHRFLLGDEFDTAQWTFKKTDLKRFCK